MLGYSRSIALIDRLSSSRISLHFIRGKARNEFFSLGNADGRESVARELWCLEDERAYSVSGAFLGFLDVSDLGRDCGKCRGYRCGRWSRADARCRPSGVSFVVCESETRTFQTLAGRRFDVEWLALCLRLPSVLARYMCASFPYHARGSSASVARCLSHFGVFAIFFLRWRCMLRT